jgi:hypothetical protein
MLRSDAKPIWLALEFNRGNFDPPNWLGDRDGSFADFSDAFIACNESDMR